MLRHSSIKVTMDLYTSVAKEVLSDATFEDGQHHPRKPLHRPAFSGSRAPDSIFVQVDRVEHGPR
ncbi:hypothetical protein DL990_14235 [Amycolatopsis sp. WAC 01416]|nr:hypothetical protein DL990_14235 [Amycolatopsis sp. WAC 01416]